MMRSKKKKNKKITLDDLIKKKVNHLIFRKQVPFR